MAGPRLFEMIDAPPKKKSPLPEGKGSAPFPYFPVAYTRGVTHATPLALEKLYSISAKFSLRNLYRVQGCFKRWWIYSVHPSR